MIDTRVIDTDAGPVEAAVVGEGPAVLSLHGTPGGAGQAMAFAAHFRDAGLRVIAPSRPGYGDTPLESGETFEQQADLLAALLSALEVERAAVYGISGGGPTMLQIGLRHRGRAACLILEDAVTERTRVTLSMQVKDQVIMSRPVRALFGSQAEEDPVSAAAGILKSTSTIDHDRIADLATTIVDKPGMGDWVREFAQNLAADHHRRGYRHDVRQITSLAEYPLEELDVPTLICHGEADSEVPVEQARRASERIPGAELFVVPEAGHIPALSDHVEELRERQLAFARAHLSGAAG